MRTQFVTDSSSDGWSRSVASISGSRQESRPTSPKRMWKAGGGEGEEQSCQEAGTVSAPRRAARRPVFISQSADCHGGFGAAVPALWCH